MPARRALDLAPLVIGILLIAACGVVVTSVVLNPRRELLTTAEAFEQLRQEALWGAWGNFGLATAGLVLIAFWIGRRVGRVSASD